MDTLNTPKDIQHSDDYKRLLEALRERVAQAQLAAFKAVNRELIGLYWDIGRTIVEKQEQLGWGENIVEQVARDLQAEFPGVRGFSRRNVFNMRRFYLTYRSDEKVQTVSAQIPWSHNTLILDACKSAEERAFYLDSAARFSTPITNTITYAYDTTYGNLTTQEEGQTSGGTFTPYRHTDYEYITSVQGR